MVKVMDLFDCFVRVFLVLMMLAVSACTMVLCLAMIEAGDVAQGVVFGVTITAMVVGVLVKVVIDFVNSNSEVM